MRFDVKALAITSSILWGLAFFCMTWWIIAFEGSTGEPIFFERIYRGGRTYEPNLELTAEYAKRFEIFQQLYPALKPINTQLHDS